MSNDNIILLSQKRRIAIVNASLMTTTKDNIKNGVQDSPNTRKRLTNGMPAKRWACVRLLVCKEVCQFESAWLCIRVITCNEVSYLESAWLCVRLLACRVEVRYTQTIHLATPSRSVFLSKHMNWSPQGQGRELGRNFKVAHIKFCSQKIIISQV